MTILAQLNKLKPNYNSEVFKQLLCPLFTRQEYKDKFQLYSTAPFPSSECTLFIESKDEAFIESLLYTLENGYSVQGQYSFAAKQLRSRGEDFGYRVAFRDWKRGDPFSNWKMDGPRYTVNLGWRIIDINGLTDVIVYDSGEVELGWMSGRKTTVEFLDHDMHRSPRSTFSKNNTAEHTTDIILGSGQQFLEWLAKVHFENY